MIKTDLFPLRGGLTLALSLVSSAAVFAAETTATQPNIIFVISDDQRYDAFGAAGAPGIHTPHLDRLSREGVYFREATIHIPQCSPSRAALLTGLAAHANGRYSNQSIRADINNPNGFDQSETTPKALKRAGYATNFVGKWHLPPDPWLMGFDKIGTWMPAGSGKFKGARLAEGATRETRVNEGFVQEEFGKSARKFIREHADAGSTQPLFLWLAFTAPHSPYDPNPDSAADHYEGKTIEDVIPTKATYEGNLVGRPTKKWVEYAAAITSVDDEVGRLLKTLDETGLSSNTVLVFIGDNGYMMGSHGRNGKAVPYEASIRVPFIIWGPEVFAAQGKTDAVASSLDLPPTFLKLAGAEPPSQWHGRDLTPVLADGKAHDITWSVSQYPDPKSWKFPGNTYRTVRTKDSKLIVWHKYTGKGREFYDIAADPFEQKNLYSDPAYQAKVKELESHLEHWQARTGDPGDGDLKGPILRNMGKGGENSGE